MRGLWRNADFLRFWTGQTISVFGSMVGATALSFTAILFLHATPLQMGLLGAMRLGPAFLAGLFAGAWVDRLRRRPLMIWADLGRAAALATLPLAALLGALQIEQVYLVALVVSILTIIFDVAYQSYLPALVGPAGVLEGNSKLSASAAVAEFGGFSLGGWLVQVFSAPLAILIDAGSFLISALTLKQIRAAEAEPLLTRHPDLGGEIGAGLKTVWQHPLLRASALSILIREFGGGIFGALVVLYMSQEVGFSPGVLGMIWAVGGASSFLGAALAPRLTRRLGPGRAMILGLAVFGLSELFVPLASGATLLSAVFLAGQQLGDGFYVLHEINLVSLRQGLVPEGILGRVNATLQFAGIGATLAGSLLGGWLGEALGVRLLLAAAGSLTLLAAAVLALSPLRDIQ